MIVNIRMLGKPILVVFAGFCIITASAEDAVDVSRLPGDGYLIRGQQVTQLFDNYERELDLIFEYLAEPVRQIDPELYRQLQTAQLAKEKSGYQVIPKIVQGSSQSEVLKATRPQLNYYNWLKCDKSIRDELAKIAEVNLHISKQSKLDPSGKHDFLIKQANQFIELKKTWRRIQRRINYNKVWQEKVASGQYERWYRDRTKMIKQVVQKYDLIELLAIEDDQLFFEKAGSIDELEIHSNRDAQEAVVRAKIKSINYAIWTRTRLRELPDYVRVKQSADRTEFIVPLFTDIVDNEFLSRFTEIVESSWQAEIEQHQYQVLVDLRRISPADLYSGDDPPEAGKSIDERAHAERFPAGAALTTGSDTTHSIGSVILLGPMDISETTLAHEFGHTLSFVDRYFRGYEDLGDDGYNLFEVGTNPDDIMSHSSSGAVLPNHLEEIVKAQLGTNFTSDDYVNQSLKHYQAAEYEQSIAASEQALDLDPENAMAYNNICVARIKLEQWDAAISACEKSILLNPNSKLARNNLSWALDSQTRGDRSGSVLQIDEW